VSTLIKNGRRIRENTIVLICSILAVVIIWRGVNFGDILTSYMCIALGISLVFTGIALVDYRKSVPMSDNG